MYTSASRHKKKRRGQSYTDCKSISGNEPSIGNVTEEKEGELEEFIDNAKIVMGTLGHKVFGSLVYEVASEVDQAGIESGIANDPLFIYERKTGIAKGRRTSEGFVVLKGSILAAKLQQSCPENA